MVEPDVFWDDCDPTDEDVEYAARVAMCRYIRDVEPDIRAARQDAIACGRPAGNMVVLILNLNDPAAREIFDQIAAAVAKKTNGHAGRTHDPEDNIRILAQPYSGCRVVFPPEVLDALDRAGPDETRVAMLSYGLMYGEVLPAVCHD
jgi:hypothetical protein